MWLREVGKTVLDGAATTDLACAAGLRHSLPFALLAGAWCLLLVRQWRLASATRRLDKPPWPQA